jgi:hypothetical protein
MYRISAARLAAAAALMLAGCCLAAWRLWTGWSAFQLAGLIAAPELRELYVLAGVGIATRFCAGATLFGLGLRLVL